MIKQLIKFLYYCITNRKIPFNDYFFGRINNIRVTSKGLRNGVGEEIYAIDDGEISTIYVSRRGYHYDTVISAVIPSFKIKCKLNSYRDILKLFFKLSLYHINKKGEFINKFIIFKKLIFI